MQQQGSFNLPWLLSPIDVLRMGEFTKNSFHEMGVFTIKQLMNIDALNQMQNYRSPICPELKKWQLTAKAVAEGLIPVNSKLGVNHIFVYFLPNPFSPSEVGYIAIRYKNLFFDFGNGNLNSLRFFSVVIHQLLTHYRPEKILVVSEFENAKKRILKLIPSENTFTINMLESKIIELNKWLKNNVLFQNYRSLFQLVRYARIFDFPLISDYELFDSLKPRLDSSIVHQLRTVSNLKIAMAKGLTHSFVPIQSWTV